MGGASTVLTDNFTQDALAIFKVARLFLTTQYPGLAGDRNIS